MSQVRSIMWQLLCSLRFLHANRVWHRDIKSGNVLAALVDGRRIVKVGQQAQRGWGGRNRMGRGMVFPQAQG